MTLKIALRPVEGRMELKHPVTGEPEFEIDGKVMKVTFHMVGTSSKQFRDAYRKATPAEKIQAALTDDFEFESRLTAACIVGWDDKDGFISKPYSPENAFELLNDPDNMWVREQVRNYLNDQTHFFSSESIKSKTKSPPKSNSTP